MRRKPSTVPHTAHFWSCMLPPMLSEWGAEGGEINYSQVI